MKQSIKLILALASFALSPSALAVPIFDLIVPTQTDLTEIGDGANGFTNNGGLWVVATTNTLTLSDFCHADVRITIDDPRISAVGDFLNRTLWTPLLPGHVVAESTRNNDYSSFLLPGEGIVSSNPFVWQIEFPSFSDVIGQHMMSWNITIGYQIVAFDSVLNLNQGERFALDFKGQRVTSVPVTEPSTLALFILGLLGLEMARRRTA